VPFKRNDNTCGNAMLHNEMSIAASCVQRMNRAERQTEKSVLSKYQLSAQFF